MRTLVAALTAVFAALGAGAVTTHADQPAGPEYRQAVAAAYALVSTAQPGDVQAAEQATSILKGGAGDSQPEIVADLAKRPPDFNDAAARLSALENALDHPATTADPGAAQGKLHDVLSMHRYDPLHCPPSSLDRLSQWVQDRIRDLLRALFGGNGGGGAIPSWVLYAIGAAVLAAVAFVVFRAAGGGLGGDVDADVPGAPRAPADYFAEADRLAAKGDRVAAIRALCAAVAGTISGQQTWAASPLTVREIFTRSGHAADLRPLLRPFEAAVYGGRDGDAATYENGAAAAAPFRMPMEVAA